MPYAAVATRTLSAVAILAGLALAGANQAAGEGHLSFFSTALIF